VGVGVALECASTDRRHGPRAREGEGDATHGSTRARAPSFRSARRAEKSVKACSADTARDGGVETTPSPVHGLSNRLQRAGAAPFPEVDRPKGQSAGAASCGPAGDVTIVIRENSSIGAEGASGGLHFDCTLRRRGQQLYDSRTFSIVDSENVTARPGWPPCASVNGGVARRVRRRQPSGRRQVTLRGPLSALQRYSHERRVRSEIGDMCRSSSRGRCKARHAGR
jgi:hypothetical protein